MLQIALTPAGKVFIVCVLVLLAIGIIGNLIQTILNKRKGEMEMEELYQDKLWDDFIRYSYKMEYKGWCGTDDQVLNDFTYGHYIITLVHKKGLPEGYTYIFTDTHKVVLTQFNLKKSQELAKILTLKVANHYNGSVEYIIAKQFELA